MVNHILVLEIGVDTGRTGCQFCFANHWYRFSINIFEGSSALGYFDPALMEIGINQALLYTAKDDVLQNLLRHELAHMMVYIHRRHSGRARVARETAHGEEFRAFCLGKGWGEDVVRASATVESMNGKSPCDSNAERMIGKVKKLLRLAESSNPHEAELATVKANQILLEYNLSISSDAAEDGDSSFYVNRVLSVKRRDAKFKAISQIVGTFFVTPVSHCGTGIVHLEVTGARANVEIAAHVARFLDGKLDALWVGTRERHPHLKGLAAKNSFLRGVAQGYVNKINRVKGDLPSSKHQLMVIVENGLKKMAAMAYPKLTTSHSVVKQHAESNMLGHAAGEKLTIQEPIAGNGRPMPLIGHPGRSGKGGK